MKSKLKSLLGILLSVALILGLFPGISMTTKADGEEEIVKYPLWVGDTQVTSENADNIDGNNKAKYDPEVNTLTLSGYSNVVDDEEHCHLANSFNYAIYYGGDEDFSIILDGDDNVLQSSSDEGRGIFSQGKLEIKGTGSIEIKSTNVSILAMNNITTKGGRVTAVSRGDPAINSSKHIIVDGGEIYATGSSGIFANYDITICSGTVVAEGRTRYGIAVLSVDVGILTIEPNVTSVVAIGNDKAFSGKVINELAGYGWTDTEGYENEEKIEINTEPREIDTFKKASFNKYPLWVGGVQIDDGNFEDVFDDGTVSYEPESNTLVLDGYTNFIDGEEQCYVDSDGDSFAVYYDDERELNIQLKRNSSLSSTNNSSSDYGYGLYTGKAKASFFGNGSLAIDSYMQSISAKELYFNTVKVTAHSVSEQVIYSEENVEISNATVEASGGNADAIYTNKGDIIISSGNVTATALSGNALCSSEGNIIIGKNIESLLAIGNGDNSAIKGNVKNAVHGIGWTDAAGTEGIACINISEDGQDISNYKKAEFPYVHTHNWVITAEDDTATVKCTAELCPYTKDKEYTVTINAEDKKYDGIAASASVEPEEGFPEEITFGDVFYKDGETLIAAPKTVGKYTANVSVIDDDENYKIISDGFEITPGDIDYESSGYEGTYDGEEHGITVVVNDPEDATVTYAESDDDETEPEDEDYEDDNPTFTDAGTYYVWYKIERDNYTGVVGCETVNIKGMPISYEPAEDIDTDYDGDEHCIGVSVSDPEDAFIEYALGDDTENVPDDEKFDGEHPCCIEAGTYYVWYKISGQNYEPVYDVATIEIGKKEVAIEWFTDDTYETIWTDEDFFIYDGEKHSPAAEIDGSTLCEGDECEVGAIFGQYSDAGTYKASVSRLTGADAGNYKLPDKFEDKSIEYTIKPKTISIDWDSEDEYTYNGNEQIPEAEVDESSLVEGDTLELTVDAYEVIDTEIGTEPVESINAGKYVAKPVMVEDKEGVYKNYALPDDSSGFAFEILKKSVTVTATDAGKVYGEANPDAYEYTVDGLVGDDKPEDVFTGSLVREEGEDVGAYDIEQGTFAIDQEKEHVNYRLAEDGFTEATFTISQKELTFKWAGIELVYNAEEQLPMAVLEGIIDGDELRVSVTLSEGYEESKDAGDYKAVVSISGEKAKNYNLKTSEKVFTIYPNGVLLDWSDTDFTYDGKYHKPTATVKEESLFGDDECNVTVTGERKDAGKYWAYASKTDNPNYVVKPGNADSKCQFEIKRAAQTISAKNITISGGTTAEIDARASAGGALSYKVKSGTDIISVDEVGVITALKKGNAVVTITADETRNYAKATKDISVKVTNTIYTVTFNANGHGKAPEAQKVAAGKKAKKPEDPKVTGYVLYGWFTDKACKKEYKWNTPVNSNITLYAKWVRIIDMYRLYNPNSGEHFYTASTAERNDLRSAGWQYEGVAWRAPETSKTPVYRVYNPNAGDHHYTISASEKDQLVAAGWKDEGIGWYSDDAKTVPIYRVYNPNATTGSHHFTTSSNEVKDLVKAGWKDEGTAWFGR